MFKFNTYDIFSSIGLVCGAVSCYYDYNLYKKYIGICRMIESINVHNKEASIVYYDTYVVVNYAHLGATYTVRLPYERAFITKMSSLYVTAEKEGCVVDIT